jgi:hypothetical protein
MTSTPNRLRGAATSRADLAVLRDGIDMHAHTAPALFRRPWDDMELAKIAREYRMRGMVLKDHDASTTARAYYVGKEYRDVDAFGSIVLNRSVGGINPHVVEAAIHYGAKMVFFPSNHSKWHSEFFGISDYPQLGRPQTQLSGPGVTVLGDDGKLTAEALKVIDIVADADVCLATGHLSLEEIRQVVDAANERGVKRVVVTHANWALCRLELDVQRELIANGAYLEYVAVSCVSPIFYEQSPAELAEWITDIGSDRLVLSSDLGQVAGPPHPEGIRELIAALLDLGVPSDDLERMVKENPVHLLGISS